MVCRGSLLFHSLIQSCVGLQAPLSPSSPPHSALLPGPPSASSSVLLVLPSPRVSLSSWAWLGWAVTSSQRLETRGSLTRLGSREPGGAGAAAGAPSMPGSREGERLSGLCDRLELTVFWMEGPSVGRLASWWNTFLFLKCRVWQRDKTHPGPPYHGVRQVGVSIKLILYQVVQHLKEEEDQLVVGFVGEKEPGRGECLDQVEELAGGRHGEALDVGRDVGQDGQQTLEQGLEPLVTRGDDLRDMSRVSRGS